MHTFRVYFKTNKKYISLILNTLEISQLSKEDCERVICMKMGLDLYDINGEQIFEGDRYTHYHTLSVGGDGIPRPNKFENVIHSFVEMYGSPFRGGKNTEVISKFVPEGY